MFHRSEAMPWPLCFASRMRRGGRGRGPGELPWFFDLFGGQQQRAERGEVRYLILDVLRDKARHGYEIIQAIEEKTGGAYRPSPGTVYPTLQLLEEIGHVRSREEDGKRLYQLNPEGEQELAAHRQEVDDAYDRLKGDNDWLDTAELHDLMGRVHRLLRLVGKAFRRGRMGGAQLRRVAQTVEEAISKIEAMVTQKD